MAEPRTEVAAGFIRANDKLTGLPKFLGLRIVDVGPGRLRAEMAVRDELLTPFKNVHGGVISAVCDHVLGCVCYPVMKRGQWAATTEFKLNLLAPVTGGVIAADAVIASLSRTQAVVRIDVSNDGRLVAIAQGTVTIRDPKA
jgi:1,4-dihydroxy-2-naphthoyl-CoA hydrolase